MISGLAPWFGAKRSLASTIVEELGEHRMYFEPFCGSMAVLIGKPPASVETVNDLHGNLINLARCVQDARAGAELYRRLRRTICCEPLFREAVARLRSRDDETGAGLDVDRAYDYFVATWLGMNGIAGTTKTGTGFCRRFNASGGAQGMRFAGAVDSIPAWRRRLRKVTVLNEDAFGLLELLGDDDGTVVYCDPPYLVKGAKYAHDFADADHERLAAALRRFRRARVVVSYYDHPRLVELYPGWTVRRIQVNKAIASANRRPLRRRLKNDDGPPATAVEALLINGRSLVDRSRGLFDGQTTEGAPA